MKYKYRHELDRLETGLLYENFISAFFALVGAASLIAVILHYELGVSLSGSIPFRLWLSGAYLIYLIKLAISILYQTQRWNSNISQRTWRYIYYSTSVITGSSLGATAFFTDIMMNPGSTILFILIIAIVSAGSTGSTSTNIKAFIIFNTFLFAPYIVLFSLKGKAVLTVIIGVYFIIMFFTARNISIAIEKSLLLKIENDAIIEKMKQSEDRFSKSFHSGAAPMMLLHTGNVKIIDVNNAFLALLNYNREELINKSPYDLKIENNPSGLVDLIMDTNRDGSVHNRQITLVTKDGIMKHCIVTVETFMVDNIRTALCMIQDFTDRIDYEKKLQDEKENYEKAAGVKARFLATMSHEIRTPMNSIIGMTNLALMSQDNTEKNDYLGVVKESAEYLLVLLNDILDISSIESGKTVINLIDTDLHKLVNNSYRTMEMFAKNRKLDFTYSIDDNVPRYVMAAPERLRQVLINLISNSVKFTPDGSIRLSVRMLENTHPGPENDSAGYIEFSVSDTGIGIPENKLDRIFESFTQGDENTFRKYGGTGLGLTISRQLIKLMNGDISVESVMGKGSTFRFTIPLIHGEKPDETLNGFFNGTGLVVSKKLLIAEDNLLNQKLITAYMKKIGHEYNLVENGADAIETLKLEKYDAVLMDLEMPVMDGRDSLVKIRAGEAGEQNKNIPVYAMSAHVMSDMIEDCLSAGFNGYVTKPIDLKKLKELLG